MIGIELVSLAGSAVAGFIFKMWANKQADEQARYEMMLGKTKAEDESRDNASNRGGVWVRRFIVLVMMTILAIIAVGAQFSDSSVVTNVITTIEHPSYFFGLFGGGTEEVVVPISGMMYDTTIKSSILSIIGYYFGSATASR